MDEGLSLFIFFGTLEEVVILKTQILLGGLNSSHVELSFFINLLFVWILKFWDLKYLFNVKAGHFLKFIQVNVFGLQIDGDL